MVLRMPPTMRPKAEGVTVYNRAPICRPIEVKKGHLLHLKVDQFG